MIFDVGGRIRILKGLVWIYIKTFLGDLNRLYLMEAPAYLKSSTIAVIAETTATP